SPQRRPLHLQPHLDRVLDGHVLRRRHHPGRTGPAQNSLRLPIGGTMLKWGIAVVLVFAGCGDDTAATPDSAVTADAAIDAPAADASPYCGVPNNDANQGHKLLYLDYEGVVLTSCSGTTGCPDPTMDKTTLIEPDGGTVPPFDSTITSRQAFLDSVTN